MDGREWTDPKTGKVRYFSDLTALRLERLDETMSVPEFPDSTFYVRARGTRDRCGGRGATALPSGSAGRLAPPGDDGHAGRVTLPQRARYPAYPILPPPQITPVLLYYAHRKSRRKFNRSEAYEEVM